MKISVTPRCKIGHNDIEMGFRDFDIQQTENIMYLENFYFGNFFAQLQNVHFLFLLEEGLILYIVPKILFSLSKYLYWHVSICMGLLCR